MTDTDFVTDDIYFAGRVKRWHSWPTTQTQTVGEHSWQVACIYSAIFGEIPSAVERAIRLHDVGELGTGDIPFPVKAENLDLKDIIDRLEQRQMDKLKLAQLPTLHEITWLRIKICDLIEMMQFSMVERLMGNMYAIPVILRSRAAVKKLARHLAKADHFAVLEHIERADARHDEVLYQMNRRTDTVGYNLKETA